MANLYDELVIATAEDGASAPCGLLPNRRPDEVEGLMDAWLQERHDTIEYEMYLDRACGLLARMLSEGVVTARSARQARGLIRAIKSARRRGGRSN